MEKLKSSKENLGTIQREEENFLVHTSIMCNSQVNSMCMSHTIIAQKFQCCHAKKRRKTSCSSNHKIQRINPFILGRCVGQKKVLSHCFCLLLSIHFHRWRSWHVSCKRHTKRVELLNLQFSWVMLSTER